MHFAASHTYHTEDSAGLLSGDSAQGVLMTLFFSKSDRHSAADQLYHRDHLKSPEPGVKIKAIRRLMELLDD